MSALSTIGSALLGEYSLFRVYGIDALAARSVSRDVPGDMQVGQLYDTAELARSPYREIRGMAQYAVGGESVCMALRSGGEIASVCWFWAGEAYKKRNFWPLNPGEIKLIQITTAEPMRRRGMGEILLINASRAVAAMGYRRMYARIWHSNIASLRTFEAAGWIYLAFVADYRLLGRGPRRRYVSWKRGAPGASAPGT